MKLSGLRYNFVGAIALFALFSVTNANAQQTSNLEVSAEVPEVCIIDSPASIPMAFGQLDVVAGGGGPGGSFEESADFIWRCSQGSAVSIGLDLGLGSGATLAKRVMTGVTPTNTLPYRLETTGGADWGAIGSGTEFTTTALGITTPETVTIDGIITLADAQAANADSFSDTVTITLLP